MYHTHSHYWRSYPQTTTHAQLPCGVNFSVAVHDHLGSLPSSLIVGHPLLHEPPDWPPLHWAARPRKPNPDRPGLQCSECSKDSTKGRRDSTLCRSHWSRNKTNLEHKHRASATDAQCNSCRTKGQGFLVYLEVALDLETQPTNQAQYYGVL